jgi:predicted acyl esterase
MGGCVISDNIAWGAFMVTFLACPPDPALVGESNWRDKWMKRVTSAKPWLSNWLRHPHYDAYWKQGSICENYDKIQCPAMIASGWADGYSNAVPRMLKNIASTNRHIVRGINGPWAHAFPHDASPGPTMDWLSEAVKWWDYCLKGDKSMEDVWRTERPLYTVYIQECDEPAPMKEHVHGFWVKWRSNMRRSK